MELESFTVVDGVVALIILISAILAFSRGFVREFMSIVGWLLAAVVAFIFAPQVEPIVSEIPYLKDVIGGNCQFAVLASFAAVFVVVLIVVSIFTPLFSGLVANSALGPMDRGLGFLFGIARGVVLIAVALIVYDIAIGEPSSDNVEGFGIAQVENSQTKVVLGDLKDNIENTVLGSENSASDSQVIVWIKEKYQQLTGSCEA